MPEQTRVLVVDDDESTCQLLSSVLGLEGYVCSVAHTSRKRIRCCATEHFSWHCLISTYRNSDGLELVKRIKTIQPDFSCVMMTAQASVETEHTECGGVVA